LQRIYFVATNFCVGKNRKPPQQTLGRFSFFVTSLL